MKSSWKQFAEWVTELRNDPFVRARFESTSLYTLSILVAFLITNTILLRFWFNSLADLIPTTSGTSFQMDLVNRLDNEIGRTSLIVYILVLLGVAFISLLINSKTMSPIRKIMRAQKRFIADASHELRTPLAIIRTNAEITLKDGDHINPAEAKETLSSIIEEVNRMSKIIENLLSLSYYDNSASAVKFEQVDLSKSVLEIAGKIKNLAAKKSIELRLLNMDPGLISGSPVAIEQVVINLIKNAVTYTPYGGWVSISVTAKSGMVRRRQVLELKIKDNGIGIDKDELPNVFNPFYKASREKDTAGNESSGLGLTIIKKIVERHNGWIYLNSAPGKGTTVIITFPLYQSNTL